MDIDASKQSTTKVDEVPGVDVLGMFTRKLDLHALELAMKDLPGRIPGKVDHHFAEGIYVRTLFIPAGALIVGKRHRKETCNILLKGKISIYVGENEPVLELIAPCIFNSKPGVKKLGYAHEDTLFANIHPTEETDLEIIENKFIIPEKEYIEMQEALCLGQR